MIDRHRFGPLLAAGLLMLAPGALAGQAPTEGVDSVVAVAGDSVVLASEVTEELLRLAASGQPLPQDPTELGTLRREIVQQRVEELILLQAAERDSVIVEPAQIDQAVEREIAQRRRAFQSDAQFTAALAQQGLTMDTYRTALASQLGRSLRIQQYLSRKQRERPAPTITENEIRAYFDERRDRLGERPATISFRQVVIGPEPADSARQEALAEAGRLLDELREGADFAALARRHSDDVASAERGGDLGWFRQGEMLPEFERAAFGLPPGAISGAIETSAGIHIIKVEKARGPERQARHILIRPETSPQDVQRALETAERVAAALRAGAAIDSLIERYGDDSEQARVGPYPIDQLPPPYDQALAGSQQGSIIGPLELDQASEPKWSVVRVTATQPAGPYTLDDVRQRIREQLQQQKVFAEILEELKQRTYIELRV